MKQLWIDFIKGVATFIVASSFITYIFYRFLAYLKLEVYDSEIPYFIRLVGVVVVIAMLILLSLWTMLKPGRAIQKAKDERVTKMGLKK
ncbi:MAG: hypothetical protein COB30_010555 [Ectothiorhodospiraceae bacterium]|nr:hypothetical protein [Ectothiorhodospiraceae bacterium]